MTANSIMALCDSLECQSVKHFEKFFFFFVIRYLHRLSEKKGGILE